MDRRPSLRTRVSVGGRAKAPAGGIRELVDHAASLISLVGASGLLNTDARALILRDAARYIRDLESRLRAEQSRVECMRNGYARIMEQAAELVGEAIRITNTGE